MSENITTFYPIVENQVLIDSLRLEGVKEEIELNPECDGLVAVSAKIGKVYVYIASGSGESLTFDDKGNQYFAVAILWDDLNIDPGYSQYLKLEEIPGFFKAIRLAQGNPK